MHAVLHLTIQKTWIADFNAGHEDSKDATTDGLEPAGGPSYLKGKAQEFAMTDIPPPVPPMTTADDRQKAIDAFMGLLADRPFDDIGLAEVAGRAGVRLSALRNEFGSTLAIYAAHVKEIDRIVLDGGDGDMGGEPARERLFDVLMRRLEAMRPYKDAMRSLVRSARRNPPLAFALNGMAVRSHKWMLEAAGIPASGPRGALRAQGAAMMFARVVGVWLDDEEDGLDRTMAALDRGLASAERWEGFLSDLCAIPCAIRGPLRRAGRRRRGYDEDTAAA
jgi:AcrR family transcriptional regulator